MATPHMDTNPGHDKTFTIVVNGRERVIAEHRLSYRQVVSLAYPDDQPDSNLNYTVSYANVHGHDGTLVDGQDVEIKNGMVFNVTRTNRS